MEQRAPGRPKIDYASAPNGTGPSFQRYIEDGILPGGFLQAVLADKLYLAVGRADQTNVRLLLEYYYWMLEFLPGNSYGSPEKMKAWLLTFADNGAMLQRLEV